MKSAIFSIIILAVAFGAPIRRQAGNIQTFTSALGGIAATPVQDSGNPNRPFQVKGDTFANAAAALARSCDQQFNACANAANGGDATVSVAQCSTQKEQCSASVQTSAAATQSDVRAGEDGNTNSGSNVANEDGNSGGDISGTDSIASCT